MTFQDMLINEAYLIHPEFALGDSYSIWCNIYVSSQIVDLNVLNKYSTTGIIDDNSGTCFIDS